MSTSTVKVRRLSSVRFSNDVKDNNNSVSALRGRTATDEDIHIINTSNVPATTSLQTLSSVAYKNPKDRVVLERSLPPSSITQPNYEDILRRVSLVIHQHCVKCEARLAKITPETLETEESFVSPQHCYYFHRTSLSLIGFTNCSVRLMKHAYRLPTMNEIYTFIRDLFVKAHLSAECSIVCLIYVERLMESAHVPLTGETWRPCLLCGLLLASKVWQDLSSWNIEIAQIYPQFTLSSVNRLERLFCSEIKWDLYISSSLYAKYYFALRALTEKNDFRRNYNVMVTDAPGAQLVAERSTEMKDAFLSTTLSRSL